jgi:subtilisin family serine protease
MQRTRYLAVTFLAPILAVLFLCATLRTASAQPGVQDSAGPIGPDGTHVIAADNNKNKVTGIVISGPTDAITGEWLILERGTVFTVTVTRETNVDAFAGKPPKPNQWVEAKGRPRENNTLIARSFRPNDFLSGEVIARLSLTASLTDVVNQYRAYSLTPREELPSLPRTWRFGIDENADEQAVAMQMSKDTANFDWAELNYVSSVPTNSVDPNDPPDIFGNPYRTWKWGSGDPTGYVNQNAFAMVNLPTVQGHISGTDVIVAVLDTGIDAAHPVFTGRLLGGRDMVSDDDVPQDGPEAGELRGPAEGHGTHVSGVIAHIAPESKILPVRVLDVDGRGSTFVLAVAIDWAVQQGADVINLSLGADADTKALAAAVAAAEAQGVVIVAAAGNDATSTPQLPAAYPGVLGVAAVDADRSKADFSNYGFTWVDLSAPGVGITSTVPVSGPILYGTWSGTSMATPFVSAAAALLKQQQPDATAVALANQLIATGSDLDPANPAYSGQLGRLLDFGAALGLGEGKPESPDKLYLPAVLRPN